MKKILVASSDDWIASHFAEVLSGKVYRAFTADTSQKGIEIAKAEYPDLIFCELTSQKGQDDLHHRAIEEAEGIKFHDEICKVDYFRTIPFIYLTSTGEWPELMFAAKYRGGIISWDYERNDYLRIPCTNAEIVAAVEYHFAKQQNNP